MWNCQQLVSPRGARSSPFYDLIIYVFQAVCKNKSDLYPLIRIYTVATLTLELTSLVLGERQRCNPTVNGPKWCFKGAPGNLRDRLGRTDDKRCMMFGRLANDDKGGRVVDVAKDGGISGDDEGCESRGHKM